jgi:PAS domain S-box-containing protein
MTDEIKGTTNLQALLEAAVDSIITIDGDGIIQSVNHSATELFGYEVDEFVGCNVNLLMPEPWAAEHDNYIHQYQTTGQKRIIGIGREVQGKRKDGSVFPMHLSVSEFWDNGAVYYCGIVHDLTKRKEGERVLARSQRMEAVGQLTGGIAHDFNNLLTVITGNLELLEMQIDAPQQLELMREAQAAAELGAGLTNQLLAFARRSVLQPETVNINTLIGDLSSMLKRTLGSHIEFGTSMLHELWAARVDPGQVETALLNLAVNARDAMVSGGSLMIETRNVTIDQQYAAREIDVEAGDYVRVSVSDTGTGMPEDILLKVFEPFFTTKQSARGTGLGLSMVYGFAKQSGGNATIYSEEGLGTTVNIYLPRHDAAAESKVAGSDNATDGVLSGSKELILVVEDDPRVRRLTLERLKVLNYRTISASDGNEALRLLADTPGIDLVFSDLVMPGGLSGYEVADAVQRQYPKIGVLLTSGYAEDLVHSDKLSERSVNLLRKPYRQTELASRLREALEARR